MTEMVPETATTRLRVEHLTRYEYANPARTSFNEARLRPVTEARAGVVQRLLHHELRVLPHAHTSEYDDYFGTHVTAFEVQRPHDVLEIMATSEVELTGIPPVPAPAGGSMSWDDRDLQERFCEDLENSAVTVPPAELAVRAAEVAAGKEPGSAALAVLGLVVDGLTYRPGSTGVHSTACDAWSEGSGVCQDYAQLGVGALRSVGIPARYVSGYLMPRPCEVGEGVDGQSHAWVEFWAGRWCGFDPTNGVVPATRHIVVGRGREYRDVRPVHGVVSSGTGGALSVSVRFTRLA